MTKSLLLRGTELRYVLTWHLFLHGPATVPELLHALAYYNFDVGGRGSKSISDALRWERRYGRVGRLAAVGTAPAGCRAAPSTESISECSHCANKRRICRSEAGKRIKSSTA